MKSWKKRLAILVCFGAIAVLLSFGYIHLFLSRPIGSGPAGPNVDRSAFGAIWSERKILVLGIGDSITAGLGANSPDRSYFNRLIVNPDDEFPSMKNICLSSVLPNLQSMNLAVSGSTSIDHYQVVSERLPTQPEDVFGLVMLTTGGNDLIHSYGRRPPQEGAMYGANLVQAKPWIEAFQLRLNEMISKIEDAFPGGCEIYLADIYDPTDGVGDAPSIYLPHWEHGLAIHSQYNEAIRYCAKLRKNVYVVPLYQTFLGHGSHCRQFWREHYSSEDPSYWFFTNIEDPNDRGYDAIRRVFLNTILDSSVLVPK
jgi:lysophospholipase L1-like esterase